MQVLALVCPLGSGRDLIQDCCRADLSAYRGGSNNWSLSPTDVKASVGFIKAHYYRKPDKKEVAPPDGFGSTDALRDRLPPASEGTVARWECCPFVLLQWRSNQRCLRMPLHLRRDLLRSVDPSPPTHK
eukprot:3570044-Amphidinium_carterae.1